VVVTQELRLSTSGHTEIMKITEQVRELLRGSCLRQGMVCLFVPGSTASITTMEFEPGLIEDLRRAWEKIAPVHGEYAHNARWHDGNGYAHVRASLVGPSLVVPFVDGELLLGTWQDVVFIDFDNRSRDRRIIVQIVGE